jgi:hypothetical protein
MNNLNTGDILLFCGHKSGPLTCFSKMIQCCTTSSYSHVAMVLKDPSFIDPPLKGLYVWESGWEGKPDPQDGKIKLGVQITPLKEVIADFEGSIILFRKIVCPTVFFSNEKLKKIHDVVYNKPYDIVPKDWVEALLKQDPNPQKTDRFWCSALIGYIYTQCGILNKKTDWSILRPSDFSLDAENLNYINNCRLAGTETRIQ